MGRQSCQANRKNMTEKNEMKVPSKGEYIRQLESQVSKEQQKSNDLQSQVDEMKNNQGISFAIQQFTGFQSGKEQGDATALVRAMGLTLKEWKHLLKNESMGVFLTEGDIECITEDLNENP